MNRNDHSTPVLIADEPGSGANAERPNAGPPVDAAPAKEPNATPQRDYRDLFDASPIPTWIQDYTAVDAELGALRSGGMSDVVDYLGVEDALLERLIRLVMVRKANRAAIDTYEYDPASHGNRIRLTSAGSRAAFVQQMAAIAERRSQFSYEYTREPDHPGPIQCSMHWSAVGPSGEFDPSNVIVSIADITNRYTAEQQIRRRAEQLELVNEVNREVSSQLGLEVVLRTIVAGVARVLAAEWGELIVLNENGDAIVERVSFGLEGEGLTIQELKEGLAGWVLAQGAPTLSLDLKTDARNKGAALAKAQAAGRTGIVIAPLTIGGRPRGTLAAGNAHESDPFTAGDMEIISLMAAHASFAIGNAFSVRQLEEQIAADTRLVAAVSHELRTPLTAAAGLASELSENWDGFTPDERVELIDTVRSQADEAVSIVDDLLVAARTDLGQMTLTSQRIELRSQVTAVLQGLGAGYAAVGVAGMNPWIVGDPVRVRQVIRNLVTNAQRHGGDDINVVIERSRSMGIIRVVDDGGGVEPDLVDRVFGEFARGSRGGTRSTGLGLHIALNLAELMNGTLRYLREDGLTIFELALPLG